MITRDQIADAIDVAYDDQSGRMYIYVGKTGNRVLDRTVKALVDKVWACIPEDEREE